MKRQALPSSRQERRKLSRQNRRKEGRKKAKMWERTQKPADNKKGLYFRKRKSREKKARRLARERM